MKKCPLTLVVNGYMHTYIGGHLEHSFKKVLKSVSKHTQKTCTANMHLRFDVQHELTFGTLWHPHKGKSVVYLNLKIGHG